MKDNKDTSGEEITLKMILSHMQHGFGRLDKRMGSLENRMDSLEIRIDVFEKSVDKRFSSVDFALQRLYTNRLKDVERIERLEEAVFN